MKIAIVGAGNVGASLGRRLAASGYEILFGVRPGKDLTDLLQQCQGRARATTVDDAVAGAGVVFLAVPAGAAVDAVAGSDLAGKVAVDCNNPLAWHGGPVWSPPAAGSVTAQLAAAYPAARWVKGFNTFGSEFHRDPALGSTSIDVHLAGDDAEAKATVAAIAERAGFAPVDCGPLRNAALLENLAVLWIHLALEEGHGRRIGFKMLKK